MNRGKSWRRAATAASAAWNGWTEELAAAFPRSAAWLAGNRRTATIDLGDEHTEVILRDRPAGPAIGSRRWPRALPDLSAEQAAELAALCRACRIDVLLPPRILHRMRTSVPHSAGATAETVRYALMTDAPLAIDKMAFDWRLAADARRTSGANAWIDIVVTACRLVSLDDYEAMLVRHGLRAARIGAPEIACDRRMTFTLRRRSVRGSGWLATHCRTLLLGSTMAVASSGLVTVGLAAQWQERSARREAAELAQRHRQVAPTAQRWARAEAIRTKLAQAKAAPSATRLLNEFARLTPPQAWLTELRIEDGRIKAIGRADNPARLAGAFSGSSVVDNVRLEAINAGADAGTGFELSAATRGRP